jgi:hypothetical protein
MDDNELLEGYVIATLIQKGMDAHPSNIVRHARQCLNETRKAQFNLDAEKFAAEKKASVYEN